MRPFLLLLLLVSSIHALELGQKAPALDGVEWIKGGKASVGGGFTVVELWATWCAPCKISIPHLTQLAKQHAGKVAIVGLTEEETERVAPFVSREGQLMEYHVGVATEELYRAYAEGIPGPPFAFIVGADGVVLWKGHPMALDRPLAQIVSGTYDLPAQLRRERQAAELHAMLETDPGQDETVLLRKVLAKTGEILAEDPGDREALKLRLGIADHIGDRTLARTTFASLPVAKLDPEYAAELALMLVQDGSPTERHLDLAWAFANRAVEAAPELADGHAALAAVQQALGMLDQAIASQQAAARLDPEGQGDALAFYQEAKRIRDQIAAGGKPTPPAAAPAGPGPAGLPSTLVP